MNTYGKYGKKMLTGAIVASFLLGGGFVGALHATDVQAADAAATTQSTSAAKDGSKKPGSDGRGGPRMDMGFRGGNVIGEAAALLGVEEKALFEELTQGKTLAQLAQEKAGLTEDALIQKLVASETAKINEAVTAGKLTQDQATKQISGLQERLKKSVEQTFQKREDNGQGKGAGQKGDGQQRGDFGGRPPMGPGGGGFIGNKEAAAIIGVTEQELADARKADKSLAEIAAEKGITEDQLIAKLKDSLTDKLKQFVESKGSQFPGKAKKDDAASSTVTGSTYKN